MPFLPLHSFSRRQLLILFVLTLAGLCSAVTFSCVIPFLPSEAKAKRLRTSDVGIIIGSFQLGLAFAAPIFGKMLARVGPNRLFGAGLCLCALAVISFGSLPALPSAQSFFWAALCLRVLMALGQAAYKTSYMSLLAQSFPSQLALTIAVLDTFTSISYSAGPLIGSLLFQVGGFTLPFRVFGSLMLLCALASFRLLSVGQQPQQIPTQIPSEEVEEDAQEESESPAKEAGLWDVLRVPQVSLTLLGLTSLQLCCFFYDASLAEHVALLNPSPMFAGSLISITAFVCMLSGPLWGLMVDRGIWLAEPLMLLGSLLAVAFTLTIGPSPLVAFFHLSVPLAMAAFAVQGLAITAMATPSMKHCLWAAKTRGGFSETSPATCGAISGLIQAFTGFGAFFGTTLGGLCAQWIGFEWTATIAAAAQFPFIFGVILFRAQNSLRGQCLRKRCADASPTCASCHSGLASADGASSPECHHLIGAV